jgi:dTDP-4-amino-4,6-dideoxygalactose transaminase
VRLPFFTNMTSEEQAAVVEAVTQFVPLAAVARRTR